MLVLALLGTAISGFILNLDQESREVTRFDYVADVSGLFTYTDAPEYIAYNPSSNLNGYDANVIYTPSGVVNNYRYVVADGTTSTTTLTISDSSDYPGDYGNFAFGHSDYGYVMAPDVRFLWDGTINFGTASTIYGNQSNALVRSIGTPIEDSKIHITRFTNVLADLGVTLTDYDSIVLDVTYNSTYPILFYSGNWTVTQVAQYDGYFNAYHTTMDESNSMPTRLVFSPISNQVTAYRNDSMIWTNNADYVGVLAWFSCENGGYANPVTCSVTFDVTLTTPPVYGYMQPTAGVKATSSVARWSNGYQNSIIEIKVTKNGDVPGNQQVEFNVGGSEFGIYYQNGMIYMDDSSAVINLGNWLAVQIRIDALEGKLILTPTNDVNLLTTVQRTAYSVEVPNFFTPGALDYFEVQLGGGGATSLKFQVTDTEVFLNTYNTVMIDPSITVGDWFPDLAEYRLNFYSFAVIGDSMTINGQTCPIDKSNGTITFDNVAGFTFTKKLENFYLTYGDNVTITFVNDNSTYDLGTIADEEVSFDGMWYFVTGLYDPNQVTETYWNWNLDGFQATAGECLIVFLGIIVAGVLLYRGVGGGKPGIYDWLVIIFGVFIGTSMLGY